MKYPRAFRDALLAYFERTPKKTWNKEEIAQKILGLWWDLPKKAVPNKSKKRKQTTKPDKKGTPLVPGDDTTFEHTEQ